MKFQGDEVLDKLNEFADSTLEFGSSLFKRLMSAEAFAMSSSNPDQNENEVINEQDRELPFEAHRESRSPNVRFSVADNSFDDESNKIKAMQARRSHTTIDKNQHPFHSASPAVEPSSIRGASAKMAYTTLKT